MTAALLLSDLHLRPDDHEFGAAFHAVLEGPARRAEAVYLLGDLFEYWIGDDIGLPLYAAEIRALRALADSGVAVYVQRGNRDFLLGRDFERASGAELLPDPATVVLGGMPTLLSHGDIWCTGDIAYQRWRRFAHNRAAQAVFMALPRALRQRIADRLRRHSRDRRHIPADAILDVTPAAIDRAFAMHGVRRIIHGHTHRPGNQQHAGGSRIVLPDWRPSQIQWLEIDHQGTHLRSIEDL